MIEYRADHNFPEYRFTGRIGNNFVGIVNQEAASYDSQYGQIVCWLEKSPFVGGTAAHIAHENLMSTYAAIIAKSLNNLSPEDRDTIAKALAEYNAAISVKTGY